jgi:hypothetical protein
MGQGWRWACLVLVTVAGGRACGQAPADAQLRQATELLAAARPHLEAVLDSRLAPPPSLRPVGAEQLLQLADPELEAHLRYHFAGLGRAEATRALHAARQAKALATVARYEEGAGVLHVLPDRPAVLAAWDESLALARSPEFLQLAVVYEVSRYVLDRRYNLARVRQRCGSAEEHEVVQALVEGRAQWVTRAVARRLGTEAYFPLLAERWRHVPDPDPDPGVRAVVQTALRQQHWACTAGLAFFSYLEDKGVGDAEQRAFTRPPGQRRWIEQPELYLRPESPNLAALLGRVEPALPPAEWLATQQPYTAEMASQVAALLGAPERAAKVLGAWVEGRSVVWASRKDPGRSVALSVVRLEASAGARAYYGFAVDVQRKRDELLGPGCAGSVHVVQARASAWQLPGLEEGARFDKLLRIGGQGAPVPVCLLLGRSGDLVLELTWHGQAPDVALAERLVRAVLGEAIR